MKTSGKGGLTIRGSKTTKKKESRCLHNGGLYTLFPLSLSFSSGGKTVSEKEYTRRAIFINDFAECTASLKIRLSCFFPNFLN